MKVVIERIVNPALAREQQAELRLVAASVNLSHLAPQARSEQQSGHRR